MEERNRWLKEAASDTAGRLATLLLASAGFSGPCNQDKSTRPCKVSASAVSGNSPAGAATAASAISTCTACCSAGSACSSSHTSRSWWPPAAAPSRVGRCGLPLPALTSISQRPELPAQAASTSTSGVAWALASSKRCTMVACWDRTALASGVVSPRAPLGSAPRLRAFSTPFMSLDSEAVTSKSSTWATLDRTHSKTSLASGFAPLIAARLSACTNADTPSDVSTSTRARNSNKTSSTGTCPASIAKWTAGIPCEFSLVSGSALACSSVRHTAE
mmetsp:Transcript_58389/g.128021  ORF Transcript_58389/g.128021 Transcript_58389/m.128021 type:complete len:275 (+) Transcript_58389:924-1748(+)